MVSALRAGGERAAGLTGVLTALAVATGTDPLSSGNAGQAIFLVVRK